MPNLCAKRNFQTGVDLQKTRQHRSLYWEIALSGFKDLRVSLHLRNHLLSLEWLIDFSVDEAESEEHRKQRRNSELSNLRELIEDIEEDLNTETSLRELVNDLKYSGDSEIDKPIENLKHYLSNIIKENTNNNLDQVQEDERD